MLSLVEHDFFIIGPGCPDTVMQKSFKMNLNFNDIRNIHRSM